MGLAASQARLLTITARKADCEFLSMSLSHQKLALARDMEFISSEYQNALNQTKLVYDYYGSGDKTMNLTYGLLMEPSIYNDYFPKLVTDQKNRVILNSAYAQAARAAGIPAEGLLGTPSSEVRNKFIEALVGANIITPTKAASIEAVTYGNDIGLGATISATKGTTEITYDELIQILKTTDNSQMYGLELGTGHYELPPQDDATDSLGDKMFYNGSAWTNGGAAGNITVADLLDTKKNIMIGVESRRGEELPVAQARAMQEELVGTSENGISILSWILDSFSSVLGGTAVNDTALQYAYNCVFDLIVPDTNMETYFSPGDNTKDPVSGDGIRDGYYHLYSGKSTREEVFECEHTSGGFLSGIANAFAGVVGLSVGRNEDDTYPYYLMQGIGFRTDYTKGHRSFNGNQASKAKEYFGFTYTADKNQSWTHKDRNDESQISISLSNLAQAFLTSFVQYMQGVDESKYEWGLGKVSEATLYDPTKDNFKFTMTTDSDIDAGDSQLYASFYDALFNRICINGWTENDRIDDEEYMGELLKNGMAFISSISDDGFYYQGNYSTDRMILEVTDDEAVARAEAKYNTEKAKIDSKEDTIDMKMKNLDTEISSLTTEYDTTKQVITKAIEKSFKRYEA